jgi:hypothetical protein
MPPAWLETHGNADFLHKARERALRRALWVKQHGTNAIGTALAMQRHCEVSGGELPPQPQCRALFRFAGISPGRHRGRRTGHLHSGATAEHDAAA